MNVLSPRRALIQLAFLAAAAVTSAQTPKGHFDGTLILKPNPDGRNMTVVEKFSYTDWGGHTLTAQPGFVTDGATIPRVAWSIVGGPWDGKYRQAAVIHDVGCVTHEFPWKTTDRLFYEAMLDSDVPQYLALTMYYAVLAGGPRWELLATKTAANSEELEAAVSVSKSELSELEKSQIEGGQEKLDVTRTKSLEGRPEAMIFATVSSALPLTETELNSVLTKTKASQDSGKPMTPEDIEKLVKDEEQSKAKFSY